MGPNVVLDVDLRGGAIELVLINIGDDAAHAIHVALKPSVKALGGTLNLATLPLFQGLGVLRPDKEIRVFVDPLRAVLSRKPQKFVARVSFEDSQGKEYERSYAHDFAAYRGLPSLSLTRGSLAD